MQRIRLVQVLHWVCVGRTIANVLLRRIDAAGCAHAAQSRRTVQTARSTAAGYVRYGCAVVAGVAGPGRLSAQLSYILLHGDWSHVSAIIT